MSSLDPTFIKHDSNFVLFQLPAGKLNKVGDRVDQASQKGNTCWFYALKRLLTNGDSHQRKALTFYSSVRKTICEFERELPSLCYALEDPRVNKMKEWTQQTVAYMLADWEISPLKNTEDSLFGRSPFNSAFKAAKSFVTDPNGTTNFYDYLCARKMEEGAIYDLALKALGLDPTAEFEHIQQFPWCGEWELLPTHARFIFSHYLLRCAFHRDCHLQVSAWIPHDGISSLIHELEAHGPHFCMGNFGQAFYKTPYGFYKKVGERNIYGWEKGSDHISDGSISHCIVIVGAEKKGDSELVYFVDPLDPSNLEDLESQRIYVMSYKKFQSTLLDLTGFPKNSQIVSSFGYAVHGAVRFSAKDSSSKAVKEAQGR